MIEISPGLAIVLFVSFVAFIIVFYKFIHQRQDHNVWSSTLISELEKMGYQYKKGFIKGKWEDLTNGIYKTRKDQKVSYFIFIECNIPFMGDDDTEKKIEKFHKKYEVEKLIIDSPSGFCKEIQLQNNKLPGKTEYFQIVERMRRVALREGFEI